MFILINASASGELYRWRRSNAIVTYIYTRFITNVIQNINCVCDIRNIYENKPILNKVADLQKLVCLNLGAILSPSFFYITFCEIGIVSLLGRKSEPCTLVMKSCYYRHYYYFIENVYVSYFGEKKIYQLIFFNHQSSCTLNIRSMFQVLSSLKICRVLTFISHWRKFTESEPDKT